MTELPDDPRRFAAKRVAKLYHKGVTGTVIEFADAFLRKLPWRWLVLVVVAGGASFLKFTAVPYLTSLAVTDWSERHGVQIEVGEWQADLWNLRVRAANLELKGTDSFSRNNLLEASAVDLDFGARYHLTQFLWGKPLWDLLRLDLSSYGLSKVVLDHAVVHVERGMSGHGNWDTTLAHLDLGLDESASAAASQPNVRTVALIEATTAPANEPSDWPSFKPRTVEIRGLKIEWIENLPGGSGGGLIRNVQETLYVDDVDVVAHGDYAGDTGELKQLDFNLEGRTADGRLSITGAWTPARETALSFRTVLENVGAHAFARMVPDPALVAVSGSMNGNIELSLVNAQWRCQGDLMLQNVAYQPVFDSYVARKNSDALQTGLRDFRANRRVEFDCNGLGNQQGFGLVSISADDDDRRGGAGRAEGRASSREGGGRSHRRRRGRRRRREDVHSESRHGEDRRRESRERPHGNHLERGGYPTTGASTGRRESDAWSSESRHATSRREATRAGTASGARHQRFRSVDKELLHALRLEAVFRRRFPRTNIMKLTQCANGSDEVRSKQW